MSAGAPFWMLLVLALAVAASAEEGPPAPKAPWPHHTLTTPFINAADFGLEPCAPDRLEVEEFHTNPDSTAGLQAALDAGAGAVVFIPAGQYRVTAPLRIQTGTTVMGAGYNATMLLTEKPIPAILHVKGVGGPMTVIRDLWTCGPIGGNWQATGIWLEGCNGITVRDCWVSALETGIRVDGISDTWLRNIVFELNQHGIVVTCPELSWASGNLRLLDCYGYQNYLSGITLEKCRGVQVSGFSAVGSGTFLQARECAQMTITGSQVNWDASPWRKFGLRLERCDYVTAGSNVVEGMVEYGIAAVDCKHLTLTGNVVRNTRAGPGLVVEGCELASVTANSVSESTGDGIRVGGCRYLSLTGNVVDAYGDGPEIDPEAAGIRVTAPCPDSNLAGNLVRPVIGGGPPTASLETP